MPPRLPARREKPRASCVNGAGGEGWKNYAHLIARVANSPRWAAIISKHFDGVARQYLAEFRKSLPEASTNAVHLGFQLHDRHNALHMCRSGRD